MGTLTGRTASLPGHCIHKLPTSCRLTASGRCCACQDRRPHSGSYSTYIDGLGLVQTAPRWHRYCFFCREFWSNRILLTEPAIHPRSTSIPEHPDQSDFLRRWHEFHQGFKYIDVEGSDEPVRVDVLLELPWEDTEPGYLPIRNRAEQITRITVATSSTPNAGTSIEETLDELLDSLSAEEDSPPTLADDVSPGPPGQQGATEGDNQLVRRDVPDTFMSQIREAAEEARRILSDATAILQVAEEKCQLATSELRRAERDLREAQTAENIAVRTFNRTQNAIRLHEQRQARQQDISQRMARVFGTREDVERDDGEYISPITRMFTRAQERARLVEEARARNGPTQSTESTENDAQVQPAVAAARTFGQTIEIRTGNLRLPPSPNLDNDTTRPPPMTDEDMTVKLNCKICFQQRADTAVLPCGHMVMCSYCADIWIPTRADSITPTGLAHCAICRRRVRRLARIFTA